MKKANRDRVPTPSPAPDSAPSPSKRLVMVVDDHPLTRRGMVDLINSQGDLRVCCEAGTRVDALEMLGKGEKPELVISDLRMPGSGLELIKDIRVQYPQTSVLVISMHDEIVHARRTLRAGARGYVMKEAGAETVLQAIRHVLDGKIFVSPEVERRLMEGLAQGDSLHSEHGLEVLSDRELQVFQCIGEGKDTDAIAQELNLSPRTVDVHRANIRSKLKLGGTVALYKSAISWVESQGNPPGLSKENSE